MLSEMVGFTLAILRQNSIFFQQRHRAVFCLSCEIMEARLLGLTIGVTLDFHILLTIFEQILENLACLYSREEKRVHMISLLLRHRWNQSQRKIYGVQLEFFTAIYFISWRVFHGIE